MAKDSALTALAAADCVAADIVRVVDTSVTTGKKVVMSDLIDAGARASQQGASGILRYDGTTILMTGTTFSLAGKQVITSANAAALAVGRQGATNPVLNVDASVATNVTGITIIGRAAAAGADILVISSGTNEPLKIDAKGTGTVTINGTGTGNVIIPRDINLASATAICDTNGNELIQMPATVASAVNEITVTNAAASSPPSISATGGDTNIALRLFGKGTGTVQVTSPLLDERTITAKTDTVTLTVAELLTKVIRGVPTAAANYTLPTAANLVAGLANAQVGDGFDFVISNKSAGANTITVLAGGATLEGTATVAQNAARLFRVVVTNVGGGTEAYTVIGC